MCTNKNQKKRKSFLQIKPSVSVKQILRARWEIYKQNHEIREIEEKEVEKALNCYGHNNGSYVYYCKICGEWIFQSFGCNSRICSNCGKRHADRWAISLSEKMFQVPHRIRHDVTMQVDEFISALIQHIPEPQFKMIRYYGAYARRTKKIFRAYLQLSIKQTTLWIFGFRKEISCPYCGGEVEFVMYMKKGPPEEIKPQRELLDWISVNSEN